MIKKKIVVDDSLVSVPLLDDVLTDGSTTISLRFLPFQVHEVAVEVSNVDILGRAGRICGEAEVTSHMQNIIQGHSFYAYYL